MPVNGFSFLSANFLFLSVTSDSVKFECRSLRGENQETRHLAGRSIQYATERMQG
jgi:hypothetical protein